MARFRGGRMKTKRWKFQIDKEEMPDYIMAKDADDAWDKAAQYLGVYPVNSKYTGRKQQ